MSGATSLPPVPPLPGREADPVRRAVLAAGLMAGAAWVATQTTPRLPLIGRIGRLDLAHDVPERFAGWRLDPQGAVLVVNPEQQAFIDQIYSQTLSRVYLDGAGQRVMLSVAYGEDQRRGSALHEPEVCYPAQGFRIQRRSKGDVLWTDGARPSVILPVQRLETVLNAQRFEPVSYWIVIGQRLVVGAMQRKLALYHYGLQGLIADGMIVRVSTVGRDSAHEFALQARFIAELLAAVPEPVRSRLAGREGPA